MYFDHLYSLTPPFISHPCFTPQILSSPPSSFSSFFSWSTEFSSCCSHTHGCGAIQRSMVGLPGTTPRKKTDSLTTSCHQLSIAPQLRVWACKPLPSLCWKVDQIALVQATTALCFQEFSGHAMSKRNFTTLFPNLWLLEFFHPISAIFPEPWREEMRHSCPICSWVLHSHLFSLLWPVVS